MSTEKKDRNEAQLASEREAFANAYNDGYLHIHDFWSSHEVARIMASLRAEGREPKSLLRANGAVAIVAKRPKRKERGAPA